MKRILPVVNIIASKSYVYLLCSTNNSKKDMAIKYPPYVNAYNKLVDIFNGIKTAAVPTKFNQDFLHNMLGLKSSSYRAMIPLLKRLEFLDANNQPTQQYKDYRDNQLSGQILATQIKKSYNDLFKASEFAYKLKKEEITSKLKTILGVGDDDGVLPSIVGTFIELVKLAEFDNKQKSSSQKAEHVHSEHKPEIVFPPSNNHDSEMKFGISYTFNLNLPATTDLEVYNAIFKSFKENLLKK